MPAPAPCPLAGHPDWPEAEAELRRVLEHMTSPEIAGNHLVRLAGSPAWPRALVAAVALELAGELAHAGPALGAAERKELALACYRLADSLTPAQWREGDG